MNSIMLEPPSPFLGPETPEPRKDGPVEPRDQADDRARETVQLPHDDRRLARGFRLADCIVRPDRCSITRPDEDTEFVEPKLMEVLLHLALADGELVERRELLDTHWQPGADCEGALTRVICALRRVLGDDCRHPRFIGTVHKHGYRLVIRAEPLPDQEPGIALQESSGLNQPLMVSAPVEQSDAGTSLFGELKRRRVIRVATAYAIAGWLIVQVAETTFGPLGVPDWCLTLLVLLVALGFPLAVVLAWAVQLTPQGPVLEMQVAGVSTDQRTKAVKGLPLVVAAAMLAAVIVLGFQFTRATVPPDPTYSCPVDEEYPETEATDPGN